MNEVKNKLLDVISSEMPKFDEVVANSVANRIVEFMEDVNSVVDTALQFIDGGNHGRKGVLLEWWNDKKKVWVPTEINDGGLLYGILDYDSYAGYDFLRGLYADWPGAFGDEDGDDWEYRFGLKEPQPIRDGEEVYAKSDVDNSWYRMRIVDLGPFSENAKRNLRELVGYFKNVQLARCGEV